MADLDWMADMPEVDDETVEETRRRYEEKQAAKLARVMGGVDDRVEGADGADGAAFVEMTIEEREAKWGFSYDELKAATKVVSILFANPSLYLGDPLLAESRLYTMVTRDRKTKRDNQEVLRQVLNEERNRKEKVKRQQDIATIRKTTMKKEREEALSNLLVTDVGGGAKMAIAAAAGGDGPQLLLTNERKPLEAEEATAAPAAAAEPVLTEESNKASSSSATTQQSAEEFERTLYHKRCLAAMELIEVLHKPAEMIPIVALPKPTGDGANDETVAAASAAAAAVKVEKIKHGNNNRKGRDSRWQKSIAAAEEKEEEERRKKQLSHADIQNWRCNLTALYNRFWPTREFSTAMPRSINFADTWPALTPASLRHLKNLEGNTNDANSAEDATVAENFYTVDTIHADLCLMTSRLGFFLESMLEEASVADAVTVSAMINQLRATTTTAAADAGSNDTPIDTLVAAMLGKEADNNSPSSLATLMAKAVNPSSAAAAAPLMSVKVPKASTNMAVLRSALVAKKAKDEEGDAEDEDDTATIGSLLESLKALLVATSAVTADSASSCDAAMVSKVTDLSEKTLSTINAVLDSSSFPPAANTAHTSASTDSVEQHRALWLSLVQLLSVVVPAHWAQYNKRFDAVHGNKKSGVSNKGGKNGGDGLYFDPENTDNDTFAQKKETIDEDESSDDAAVLHDPFEAHPLLARRNFAKLSWIATCYYSAFLYYSSGDNGAVSDAAGAAAPSSLNVLDSSPLLFNGIKLAWLGLPPEAEVDGTIPNEEGFFEAHPTATATSSAEEGDATAPKSGIPYQDAMLFAAPSAAPSATADGDDDGNSPATAAAAPAGCIVALRKDTSRQFYMNRTQKCHTCKGRYKFLHPFYYSMCRPCSDYNYNKRLITRDLRGKVVLLTGARIKIGYAMAVSLLRCGATVIGTTRFAMDAMGRFAAEPDFNEWRHRLHLYSVDLRDMWLVTQFCNFLSRKFPKLFAIINNAAQTIARTAAYTADLRRLEANPPEKLMKTFNRDESAAEWRQFFLENTSVTVGQALHLEYHPTENPIVDGEFNSDNTQLRSLNTTAFGDQSPSLHNVHAFGAAAESFLAKETPEEKVARLRRDGGDAITHVTMSDDQLATHLAKRSDRYDTFAEESDKREKNSWTMNLGEVQGSEAAEVMAINALSPFILNSRLKPLLMNRDGEEDEEEVAAEERARLRRQAVAEEEKANMGANGGQKSNRALKREAMAQADGASEAWNTKKGSRFIINVSAMEGQFYRHKLTTHPHTNMAKAALNMMTRTSAEDYARDGIFMNSVDTGWITDESPATKKQRRADDNMLCPLDEVDAAGRCLDLIYTDSREYGKFWKNYKVIPW